MRQRQKCQLKRVRQTPPVSVSFPPIADTPESCELARVRPLQALPLVALFALAGCNVRLPIEEARAEGVELAQVQGDAASGTPVEAKGPWTELNVSISRATLSKIALWQLYSSVHVTDCKTGALRDIAWMKVYGIDARQFSRLSRLIRLTPHQQHYWLVGYILHAQPGSCAKLEGGSYLGQKISSENVPIKLE